MKGLLLDSDDDLQIRVIRSDGKITSGLVIAERTIQDAYIVLTAKQGDIKEDPIVGANLHTLIRGSANKEKIRKRVEISLARVGIRLTDIENELQMYVNGKEI